VLVRTRPAKGLLGGMTEVPTTEWSADFDESKALDGAPRFRAPEGSKGTKRRSPVAWRGTLGVVRHVFTHFPLELRVFLGQVPAGTSAPPGMRWIALAEIGNEALPSLMRKVVAHALPSD
jgi:A/G-specific adenine glycosylase